VTLIEDAVVHGHLSGDLSAGQFGVYLGHRLAIDGLAQRGGAAEGFARLAGGVGGSKVSVGQGGGSQEALGGR